MHFIFKSFSAAVFATALSANATLVHDTREIEQAAVAAEAVAIAELDVSEQVEQEFEKSEGQKSTYQVASLSDGEPAPHKSERCRTYAGKASHYGDESGSRTANGERFNPGGMTAAHRSLPFGTRLQVTNLKNGRTVNVRVNDRGPFIAGRVLDLSTGAAAAIGFSGLANVSFVACR